MIDLKKPAELTAEEQAAFTEKNKSRGTVQKFEYDSDETPDKPSTFYVARPARQMMEAIAETSEKKGITAGNDLLINCCVLAGDLAQLQDDDALYFGLLKDLTGLLEAKKKRQTS